MKLGRQCYNIVDLISIGLLPNDLIKLDEENPDSKIFMDSGVFITSLGIPAVMESQHPLGGYKFTLLELPLNQSKLR